MSHLMTTCDFCGAIVDERGKRTRTNALCEAHLTKATSIPKKAGKKAQGTIPIVSEGLSLPRMNHKFSGSMGYDFGIGR